MSASQEEIFVNHLNVLINAVTKAQKSGVYSLEEAAVLYGNIKAIKESEVMKSIIDKGNSVKTDIDNNNK